MGSVRSNIRPQNVYGIQIGDNLDEFFFIHLGRWVKANSSPVCFGAKNNQYGKFSAPSSGNLAAVKLVHLYGYVSCASSATTGWSHWGCGICWTENQLNVVITTIANGKGILLPPSQFMISAGGKWYKIRGYSDMSPELVLSFFSHPHSVTSGQELRVWYGEDLMDSSEDNNDGRVCCDVYALFV